VQLEHGKEKYGDTVLRQNIRKEEKQMKIGNKEFDLKNHAYVMGILNVTPDSFSDGGKWNDKGRAMRHTQEMIEQGATIIDIGGESTRPGYTLISDEEEISRVVPMIEMVKKNFDVPVSIDTYKSRVAEAALDAGADLVNDIWGLKYDPDLAGVIARKNAPCCLMHNRKEPDYTDFIADFLKDMQETIDIAKKAGIADENIILDPGVGFGKTYENNLEIINKLECMHVLGYPILLGTSRKSVIGLTLDLPADQRMEGTVATTVIGVMKGVAFVRVHDVKENYRALKMTEAILGR
jgi:dihydropteroate synthase